MSSNGLALIAIATCAAACGDVATPRDVQCGTQPIEVLPNGSFDDATPPWTQDPVTPALLCGAPRITPFNGTQGGCLGGVDGTTQTLTQTIPLPEGARTLSLSGEICIDTLETAKSDNDTIAFDVLDGATVISALGKTSNQQGAMGCQFKPFQLTAAASTDPVSATLRIRSTLDGSMTTSFYLDALSLTVGCTP
jgi:hypothetical protein